MKTEEIIGHDTVPEHVIRAIAERFICMDDSNRTWFDLKSNETRASTSLINWVHATQGLLFTYDAIKAIRPRIRSANRVAYHPNKPRIFEDDTGYICVNKWTGWKTEEGDIVPFLTFLREAISGNVADISLLLDTVAARMQRNDHIPYGFIFVGDMETSNIIMNAFAEAFGESACGVSANQIFSKDRRWINYSSLAVVRDGSCIARKPGYASAISNLIMSPTLVNTGTSSRKATTRYETVNRLLMMVAADVHDFRSTDYGGSIKPTACVPIPTRRTTDTVRTNLLKWLKNPSSGPIIADWLLERDISGFEIANFAPENQYDKMLATVYAKPFQRVARNILESEENACAVWISNSLEWADRILSSVKSSEKDRETAESIRAFMPEIKISPFYTAKEILNMFPDVSARMKSRNTRESEEYASMVAMELASGMLPVLMSSEDPRGFMRGGKFEQFFVVHDFERWKWPISQKEFDKVYSSFGTYRDYVALGTYGKVNKNAEDAKPALWWRSNAAV